MTARTGQQTATQSMTKQRADAPSHRSATRCRRCGGHRRTPQGQAAVPVGGVKTTARQISHAIPPRHDPTQAQKPQNINDQISKPEIPSGELHAKLMIDSQDWATDSNPGPGCGARGRWRGLAGLRDRPLRAAGSRVAISRAGRRPRAHQAARPRQRIQKRPPVTGWAHLSRLWESNPRPIHYE